jgi:hypothetical protein
MLDLADGNTYDFENDKNKAYSLWVVAFKREHGHDPSVKSAFDFGVWWKEQSEIYEANCIRRDN